MDFSILDFVKLSSDIKTPTRATQFSVGLYIYCPKDYTIEPQSQVVIPTGLQVKILQGYYGHLCSKSGLAMKHGIHVGAGIIDPDYTGEIKILLLNLGSKPFPILTGNAIAQLISMPILHKVNTLPPTTREDRGCGMSKSNTL